jgi:hypothetical protein
VAERPQLGEQKMIGLIQKVNSAWLQGAISPNLLLIIRPKQRFRCADSNRSGELTHLLNGAFKMDLAMQPVLARPCEQSTGAGSISQLL